MKKIIAVLLTVVMGMVSFVGCGGSEGPALKEGTTMKTISGKVNAEFGPDGAIAMAAEIDEQMLNEQYHVDPADLADFYGTNAMSMTNSDAFLAVRVKDASKLDAVKKGLEQRKSDLENQFEQYPVCGSFERAKSAEVYVKGDCVFFICIGILPDGEYNDEDLKFGEDVAKAKTVIDSFFE